jgi:opacity protein-like surface antigen
MKLSLLALSLAAAVPAIAGTSAKEVIAPAAPSLWSWFAGASIGQLDDFDETMYHGHVGVDTPWSVGGWGVALFAELGQVDAEKPGYQPGNIAPPLNAPTSRSVQEFEIMPLTFNVKLERPITGQLSAYMGAGLGVAFVDYSVSGGFVPPVSDEDEAFAAQAFAGLLYNVAPSVEIFGGARWIYVDYTAPVAAGPEPLSFDDDFLFEVGMRYNF